MAAEYPASNVFSSSSFKSLRDFILASAEGDPAEQNFEDYERKLHQHVMAWTAEVTAAQLSRYDVQAQEISVNGEAYRQKLKCGKEYCGLAGTFTVERTLYVPKGGVAGKAICPLNLRAGIIEETWTPLAARVMTHAVAISTPKEARSFFDELGAMKPSTSSLDRLPKRLSETWEAQRQAFEDELRAEETIPAEVVTVAASLDGVMMPTKPLAGENEASGELAATEQKQATEYREASCGTVSLYDAEGNRLQSIRYGRWPEEKKGTVKSQLEAELRSILSARPDLKLMGLSDGAGDHWEFLESLPKRLGLPEKVMDKALHCFHAFERVKKALAAYHGEATPEANAAFSECRIWLQEKADGVERVLRALRYRRDRSKGKTRQVITTQIKYIEKRKHLMRYKRLLDNNMPIGTGVTEAACKTLVTERMKRSGMSWREQGGQAILTTRSLLQSDRWDRAWRLLVSQYRALVTVSKAA